MYLSKCFNKTFNILTFVIKGTSPETTLDYGRGGPFGGTGVNEEYTETTVISNTQSPTLTDDRDYNNTEQTSSSDLITSSKLTTMETEGKTFVNDTGSSSAELSTTTKLTTSEIIDSTFVNGTVLSSAETSPTAKLTTSETTENTLSNDTGSSTTTKLTTSETKGSTFVNDTGSSSAKTTEGSSSITSSNTTPNGVIGLQASTTSATKSSRVSSDYLDVTTEYRETITTETTEASMISCEPCHCLKHTLGCDIKDMDCILAALRMLTKVQKSQLSLSKRKKISIWDDRLSATLIGSSGALVLVILTLAILIPDLIRVIRIVRDFILRRFRKYNVSCSVVF